MPEDEAERIRQAAAGDREAAVRLLHDPSVRVVRALLGNERLAEEDILVIAARKNVPADILQTIARDKRWAESYPIRLALARNPKSPISVSLSMARFLRIFDLEEIARNHFIPLAFRHKIEAIVIEKLPVLEAGSKKTLARTAAGNVLLKLLQDTEPEVARLCLDNPHLVEGHLFKTINRNETIAETIRRIAEHPKWSTRPLIRFSLVRNPLTPPSLLTGFLQGMTNPWLRELRSDPHTPAAVKTLLIRELRLRSVEVNKTAEKEPVLELSDAEIEDLLSDEEGPWSDETEPQDTL